MSSPSMQASALAILAQRLAPQHLIKCGITSRRSEAEHIVAMVKEAAETLRATPRVPSPMSGGQP